MSGENTTSLSSEGSECGRSLMHIFHFAVARTFFFSFLFHEELSLQYY